MFYYSMTTSLCALQLIKMSVIQNDTWIWGELLYVVKNCSRSLLMQNELLK